MSVFIHCHATAILHSDIELFIIISLICREPGSGFTPLMEAAASGHEIIVQYLLDHVSKSLSTNFPVHAVELQRQEMCSE